MWPCVTINGEFTTSRNVLEVMQEDGTGFSFIANMFVGGEKVRAYIRFNPVTQSPTTYIIRGEKVSL
jgi:hypothetical protein